MNTLEPFFQDNDNFYQYLDEQINDCNNPQQSERLTQLKRYKKEIEDDQFTTDNLFYQPKGSACDWDENTWTLRLANGLKLNHNGTKFTVNDAFSTFQCELSNRVSCKKVFILHGLPDILLKKSKLISTATTAHCADDSSSDESFSPLEITLQRHPMKSRIMDVPEKLGEVISSCYVLLVCKLLRKVLSGKPIIDESSVVKGLLLDKSLGAIHIELIGRVSQPNDRDTIKVIVYDASGKNLDSKTLCAHLQLLHTSYSSFSNLL